MFINKLITSPAWVAGFLVVAFAAVGITLAKPVGSIQGRVSVETVQQLKSFNVKGRKIHVKVEGPRAGGMMERVVWVKDDGYFRVDQLPKGEYALSVRAPGFETYNETSVYVDEGRVANLKTAVVLNTMQPSINVASKSRVFTTTEVPHFWVNAYGGTHVAFQIFPKSLLKDLQRQYAPSTSQPPLEIDSSLSYYKPTEAQVKRDFKGLKPVWETQRKLEMDYEDWARADFKLEKPLGRGDYVALVKTTGYDHKADWSLFSFNVSDMGLVVKQAPDKAVVRALDLNTLKPLSGVSVNLFNRENKMALVGRGITGTDGYVTVMLPPAYRHQSSFNLVAYGEHQEDRAYGGLSFWKYETDQYETYFYTERPVYRRGQSVYFKGITRKRDDSGDPRRAAFLNPGANLRIQAVLEDPDNNKLGEQTLTTNAFGSFHGVLDIPKDGKTGAYLVTLNYPDGSTSTESLEVLEYRKPDYQVEVMPLEKFYYQGQQAQARIRATYYFGAPVANARVKYSVYASNDWNARYRVMNRPAYYDFFDDWNASESSNYGGDYITEGYAQTDANGEAIVTFRAQENGGVSTGPYSGGEMDQRFKVEAEVTDLSRMSVIGSGSVPVLRGDMMLFVEPKNWVVRVGEAIDGEVRAVNNEGKPVANASVQLKLVRWSQNGETGDYTERQALPEATVQTDALGIAKIHLVPDNSFATDTYTLSAKARDSHGRMVSDAQSFWIASPNQALYLSEEGADKQPFAIKLDKPVYQAGETAKVMITGPFTGKEGAQAIVSIEADKLYDLKTIPLDASAKLVEIPILASYQPNVYVSVTMVGSKHQFYHTSEMVKVSPQEHFLRVAVTTDKETYHPGEDITYTVQTTTEHGKPVPHAEVSLDVVDESIYAIRPEAAMDIRKFFYKERENDVTTISTFPEQYSAGPDKIEPLVRKNFQDLAGWYPNLVTDAQGIARMTFKLPDNLTTWRATVRAVSMATDVGWGVDKVISTQDLLVRLALPRFYTVGDEGVLAAVVHNYTKTPQSVRLTLAVPLQMATAEPLVQQLTVAPHQAARYNWNVTAHQPVAGGVFQVKAVGQTSGDALEMKRDVLPLGLKTSLVQVGQLDGEAENHLLKLALPKGVDLTGLMHTLSASASSIGSMMGQFDKLIDYPYGCTEQTMSRLYPAIIAGQLHETLGVAVSGAQQKKLDEVYQKSLDKLYDYQHGSGAWGWWKDDADDMYLTSYVLEGFSLLKASRKSVDSDYVTSGIKGLQTMRESLLKGLLDPKLKQDKQDDRVLALQKWSDLAYSQYVLSLHGVLMTDSWKKVFISRLKTLDGTALSYLVLAADNSKQPDLARQAYQALLRKMLNAHTYWSVQSGNTAQTAYWDYRYTDAESTALGLRAVLVMAPQDTRLIGDIKNWLMTQRDESAWANTKTTAQVLHALMREELTSRAKTGETDYKVALKSGEKLLAELGFNAENQFAPEQNVVTPFGDVMTQGLKLLKTGPGRLFYQSLVTYWLPLKAGEPVPVANSPQGLTVSRMLYRLSPTAVTSDGKVHFNSTPIRNWQLKAGETVLMKVMVQSPVPLPYVMLEAPLPSGAEVVEQDHENLIQEDEAPESFFSGDWGFPWWGHRDVLDDKVVFFAHHLPPQKEQVFYITVRMEMPGRYLLNPVRLESMYTKQIKAYTGVDQVQVTE